VVYSNTIEVATGKNKQLVDITAQVERTVSESGIADGLVLIFTVHTTTGLLVNERERGLIEDIESVLCKLVPSSGSYLHDRVDDNSASHIQSVLLSASLVLPVEDGRLVLGTWQSVFLAERDGPRRRRVLVKVVGDRG
jgi:secondary thiamine-phosphate synthase enzyme